MHIIKAATVSPLKFKKKIFFRIVKFFPNSKKFYYSNFFILLFVFYRFYRIFGIYFKPINKSFDIDKVLTNARTKRHGNGIETKSKFFNILTYFNSRIIKKRFPYLFLKEKS
jgi:hypothetical protein